ncbi:MAG: helix-turn-helix domain-containing protein [Deltaproteobacteria bacterium]|nr:helix-turn-helix domain-containing protein [Deltaproteobacteria bacterium]
MSDTESIGTYLRRARELRKIPLEDVSQATKIHIRSLQALERDDIQSLPGPVFTRGFIQSYARTIGLNAQEAVLHFEEQSENGALSQSKTARTGWLKPKRWRMRPWILFVAFLTVVFAAAFLSSR